VRGKDARCHLSVVVDHDSVGVAVFASIPFCLWLQVGIASRMIVKCLHGIVAAAGVADCVGGDQQNKNENAVGHDLCSGEDRLPPMLKLCHTVQPFAKALH